MLNQKPFLNFQGIQDEYMRRNMQNLHDYFKDENQLLGFKFLELSFSVAGTGVKRAHGLKTAPLDVIVTRITGAGAVTFRYDLFDDTYIVMDVTGACRIRFYLGTYSKLQSSVQTLTGDEQEYFATPASIPAVVAPSVVLPLTSKLLATGEYPGSTPTNLKARVTDKVILASAAAGSVTATLPLASLMTGQFIWVKKTEASGTAVVVAAVSLIDGATSVSLTTQVAALFFCDGTTYYRMV